MWNIRAEGLSTLNRMMLFKEKIFVECLNYDWDIQIILFSCCVLDEIWFDALKSRSTSFKHWSCSDKWYIRAYELNLWLIKKIKDWLKTCNVSFSNTIIIKTMKFHNKSFNQIYCHRIIKNKNQLQHHQTHILGSITPSLDYEFFIWISTCAGVHAL